jgi:hypothetical protein
MVVFRCTCSDFGTRGSIQANSLHNCHAVVRSSITFTHVDALSQTHNLRNSHMDVEAVSGRKNRPILIPSSNRHHWGGLHIRLVCRYEGIALHLLDDDGRGYVAALSQGPCEARGTGGEPAGQAGSVATPWPCAGMPLWASLSLCFYTAGAMSETWCPMHYLQTLVDPVIMCMLPGYISHLTTAEPLLFLGLRSPGTLLSGAWTLSKQDPSEGS